MKLLDPSATQEAKNAEEARILLRLQELNKLEKDFRLKLANAEADFNSTLAENRKKWEMEEGAYLERKKEIKKELDLLEAEKLKMLMPFDILKEGADADMKDAAGFLKKLRERKARAEELSELLENKLDEVGDKQESLNNWEGQLILRKKGIESQAESVKNQSELLTNELREFSVERSKKEEELQTRENAVSLRENSTRSKESGLIEKEDDLRRREMQLKDAQGVLERAWTEFQKIKERN